MAEEPLGYVIGIKEVFEELRGLKDTLTSHMAGQDLKVQAIDHRVTELEKDKNDAAELKRSVRMAVITALVFPIIVGVIVGVILALVL